MGAQDEFEKGDVIRENQWMRVYRSEDGGERLQSKFLFEEVQVSADEIRRTWPLMSEQKQFEFVQAYQAKPKVTLEDEKILDFLIETGNDVIWTFISALLPRHSEREKVLNFLFARIQRPDRLSANYYQALEVLGDPRAVQPLEIARQIQKEHINSGVKEEEYAYLVCCRSLWKLRGSEGIEPEIRKALSSPDPDVRAFAETLLRG
jgi:hypothetical protein